jgi:ABC-type nitrate/sulfonate/bicarbonate transport system permease component
MWWAALTLGGVNPLIARTPAQVWHFLVTSSSAADNRAQVLGPLGHTLIDSMVGFVAGLTAAIVIAVATYLSRGLEAASLPLLLIIRSVPLVALAPVITLIFGNGFATVAVMSGIVVLFPALVTISYGLRWVTPPIRDLITVYGGSTKDVLIRVAFPSAAPSVLAAVRVSVPGAITGALIAEFFTTPTSVGRALAQGLALYEYDLVWSLLAVTTIVSILLYMLAQAGERLVMRAMGLESRA